MNLKELKIGQTIIIAANPMSTSDDDWAINYGPKGLAPQESKDENAKALELQNKIIDFFWKNPNPDDSKIHALADELQINPHELETNIYAVLSSLIHLKGSDHPDTEFDAEQLKMGQEVESEHHDHPLIRRNISVAHLLEMPDYYTRLKEMEDKAKK